jgi:hypothetical protein
LGIFSYEIHTILSINIVVLTFECQAWITNAYIKQKFKLKICFKCVIFASKILQKLGIFLKWALLTRHLDLKNILSCLMHYEPDQRDPKYANHL